MDNLEEQQTRLHSTKEGMRTSHSDTSSNDGSVFSQSTAETNSDLDDESYKSLPEGSRIREYIRKKSSQQVSSSSSTGSANTPLSGGAVTTVKLSSFSDHIWNHCVDADFVCAQLNYIASEADDNLVDLEVSFQTKLKTNSGVGVGTHGGSSSSNLVPQNHIVDNRMNSHPNVGFPSSSSLQSAHGLPSSAHPNVSSSMMKPRFAAVGGGTESNSMDQTSVIDRLTVNNIALEGIFGDYKPQKRGNASSKGAM